MLHILSHYVFQYYHTILRWNTYRLSTDYYMYYACSHCQSYDCNNITVWKYDVSTGALESKEPGHFGD
jgi:hypothetical protein